ncbi:proliferation-associated protein 2g4 [Cyclospora cayetanensis]|uniref:Proliferation-associated protein 2g4 n=1 Tax=Cyclospora cayetanensis TaxID=88456 RepID=A0A1D3D501_9EIME|nr:proliferation-associated protein 2g4 [Cyclospora cayetanensis]
MSRKGVLCHQLKQHVIEGSRCFPIVTATGEEKQEDFAFEPNEVYAIDIVLSTGEGKAREAELRPTVFRRAVERKYILKSQLGRAFMSQVENNFPTLPFSLRQLSDERACKVGVAEAMRHELLIPYAVMQDKAGELTAEFKFTVHIAASGIKKVTGLPFAQERLLRAPELKSEELRRQLMAKLRLLGLVLLLPLLLVHTCWIRVVLSAHRAAVSACADSRGNLAAKQRVGVGRQGQLSQLLLLASLHPLPSVTALRRHQPLNCTVQKRLAFGCSGTLRRNLHTAPRQEDPEDFAPRSTSSSCTDEDLSLASNTTRSSSDNNSNTPLRSLLLLPCEMLFPGVCAPVAVQGRSLLLLASAGSGKTLSYVLPLLSRLYGQLPAAAAAGGRSAQPHCPRLIILVPTRELAKQIYTSAISPLAGFASVTDISAFSGRCGSSKARLGGAPLGGPLSACVLAGGGSYAAEVGALRKGVDIAICTPARLLLHLKKRNVLLQQLQQLVVEEADTLCDSFYANETRFILSLVVQQRRLIASKSLSEGSAANSKAVQLVFHFLPMGASGGLPQLVEALGAPSAQMEQTIVFCNTLAACRAVDFYLRERGFPCACCHGEMPFALRQRESAIVFCSSSSLQTAAAASSLRRMSALEASTCPTSSM